MSDAVVKGPWPKNEPTLEQRAKTINAAFDRADGGRIEAGEELLAAYEEVVGRPYEPGNRSPANGWLKWLSENVKRSRQDCVKVMNIASADDPQAALEESRVLARERMKRIREHADDPHDPTESMEDEEPEENDIPYNEQPEVQRAAKALLALNYHQRLYVWKHVLPKLDPKGAVA